MFIQYDWVYCLFGEYFHATQVHESLVLSSRGAFRAEEIRALAFEEDWRVNCAKERALQ